MRRSIASVSLSGPLNEKLTAASVAGFDGIELFDQDLITSLWTPARIRERCEELNLRIEMLQPFRDLEALSEKDFDRALTRFESKLDLMGELGTDLILVCANCRPDAIDDDELSARQLHRAAELAHERGMRIAFEALAWSTHVWDYRRAWKIVELADHPALGTCQDTFHVLSRGLDPFHIRGIPGDKIFIIQLSDAPQLAMDILQWSRHHRVWPGQGSWDVIGFLENCLLAGYDGVLSLEIFNTVFRRSEATRNARDALRSLIFVEDGVAHRGHVDPARLDVAPPPPTTTGLDFLELAVKTEHPKFVAFLNGLGFRHVADHTERPIEMWQQGEVRILLNSMEEATTSQVGPHISGLAVTTTDPAAATDRARHLRAEPLPPGLGPVLAEETSVLAPDGTGIFFSSPGRYDEHWEQAYRPREYTPAETLDPHLRIDSVSMSQHTDHFDEAALFIRSVLGLATHEDVEIPATYGLFRSRSMANPDRSLRLTVTVALLDGGIDNLSEDEARKHAVAFSVSDLFAACERVWAGGGELTRIGHNYYVDLAARCDLPAQTIADMERLGIIYDGDETISNGLFQAFTPLMGHRVFFELCQRIGGYDGYGVANAPVRISALRGTTPGLPTHAADEGDAPSAH